MSANSGAEILNRVFVEGQTAGGERLVVERSGSGQYVRSSAISHSNPSFDVNTAGWVTIGDGVMVRDTTVNHSGPASLGIHAPGSNLGDVPTDGVFSSGFTGTWEKGRVYRVTVYARRAAAAPPYNVWFRCQIGTRSMLIKWDPTNAPYATWVPVEFVLTPAADATAASITVLHDDIGSTSSRLWIDSITVDESVATLVDRRGFIKSRTLPIRNRITQASGERLADLYLQQHQTTPFAGGFKAVGLGGVRRVLGGQTVHPGWLGRDTGQLVRASHVIDPDIGGVGRDERIKAVQYDHNTLTASVSLAEDRGGFDALLERLAAVVGS